ncbi:MAG TPA: MlaD family protein [Terriglobales bacterium]|nr:MlaD family protein [Terriglobales bacterium]
MPSEKQLKWSQIRVGLTVLFALVALGVLIFLMSGTVGLFASKMTLYAYFEDAGGLRKGSPTRLEGVDIGNVSDIRLVARKDQPPPEKTTPASDLAGVAGQVSPAQQQLIDKPVQVRFTINQRYLFNLRKDSIATLQTAGVLGETFVNIDSTLATGQVVENGDILLTHKSNNIEGMVSASQTAIQNMDVLIRRADRILTTVETGQGSLGLLINDKQLYRQLNATLADVQSLVGDIASGKGSLGPLLTSDEMYRKLNDTVDKLNKLADDIDKGPGTVPRLIQDPSLYNSATAAVGKINKTLDTINSGQGAIGEALNNEQFARKLDNTMTRLSNIMDRIDSGQGSVGKLLQDPALYDNSNQAIVEVRNLLTAIRKDPKKYLTIHLKIF